MSQETLDLRRSIQIIRRHKLLMGIMVALGILAGGAYAVLKPSMVTSTALVLLSQSGQAAQAGAAAAANGGPDPWTATQLVIAKSNPVLSGALPHVRPAMSIDQLRSEVEIGSQTAYIISVSAGAKIRCRCGGNRQCRRRELYRLHRLPKQSGWPGSGPAAAAGDKWYRAESAETPRQLRYFRSARRGIRCGDRSYHSACHHPQ